MFLFSFNFPCGRSGSLDGMFAVDQRGKDALDALIASKTVVDFGEVLGKHSDVFGPIAREHVTPMAATPDEIAIVLRVLGREMGDDLWSTVSGFNPLEAFSEQTELAYTEPFDVDRFMAACRGEDWEAD